MYARVKETSGLKSWRRLGLIGLSGLIGLGGLTSCSSEQPEELQEPPVMETAIAFAADEQQEATVTRAATSLQDKKVYEFKVWGYKNTSYDNSTGYGGLQAVFPGYTVKYLSNSAATTATNSNGWEYVNQQPSGEEQTIKYWDWSAKAYRYFAMTGTYTANDAYTEFTMAADCSGATDEAIAANMANAPFFSHLWFSTGDPVAYPDKQFGKPVQLEFLKPFARVRFLFKYAYPREGISLGSTKSFKPSDGTTKIARKGSVTVSYPLTGTATRESYTISAQTGDGSGELTALTEDYDPEDDGKEYPADAPGGWYTVLPVLTQGSFTLTATVNGQERIAVVPAEYMTWLPGYSYTYIFKITEEGGVEIGWVEYAVTEWIDLEADWTVYNW